eukprot:1895594-Rhodomonas_salina.1
MAGPVMACEAGGLTVQSKLSLSRRQKYPSAGGRTGLSELSLSRRLKDVLRLMTLRRLLVAWDCAELCAVFSKEDAYAHVANTDFTAFFQLIGVSCDH